MPTSVTVDLLSFGIGVVVGILLFIAIAMPILNRGDRVTR